jgi:predicted O-methyltransferase YrrM
VHIRNASVDPEAPTLASQAFRALVREGPFSLARRIANYTRWAIEVRLAALLLRAKARRAREIDQTLDLIQEFRVGRVAITAWQVRSELGRLLATVESEQARTVLEIGTALGGTLFGFAQAAAPDAVLVTVDLPEGRFGGGYYPARSFLYRRFARAGQSIHLVLGDSHSARTLAHVQELLGGRLADILFVDGDHSYEGVRADFKLYGPLVRPGGLIAFHDIVPGDEGLVGGVPLFWDEVKRSHETTEYVESWDQEAYGIGLIRVPTRSSGRPIFESSAAKVD